MSTTGVDGVTLKHWATFRGRDVALSESGYIGAPSLMAASSAGNNGSVTRVEGVVLLDT